MNLILHLDCQNFERQCFFINGILTKEGYFSRIYEFRKKIRYLIHENTEKKNVKQNLSSFLTEKFNGFFIVRMEYDKKKKTKFLPIDVIHKPVKDQKMTINCYFLTHRHLVYRSTYNDANKTKHSCA